MTDLVNPGVGLRQPSVEIPGPRPVPLLGWRGNALKFFQNPVGYMIQLKKTFGNVARLSQSANSALMFRSTQPDISTVFAFGPECIRQITMDLETFESRRPPGPPTRTFDQLCTNFFFINGDRHKQQRPLMMPAFTRSSLQSYYDDMVYFARQALDRWKVGEAIELDGEMCRLTMNISSKTLYGLDPSQRDQDLADLMVKMVNALFSPVTMIPLNVPGAPYWKLLRRMETIIDRLKKEIENKRNQGVDAPDVLSMMVRAHDEDPTKLTLDELIGQSFVMFFAGHDTSAKALLWTLFLLAQHPEVMANLHDELEASLRGSPPTYEQIFALPYLDQVTKESLRILTPAVMFAREVSRTTQLGGYEIPEGSEVIYSPYVTHVDPEIYSQPYKFLPERWSSFKPTPYEYLPFGAGSRTCLGVNFAGIQLRLLVAMIVQRYRLEVVPGTRIDIKTNVVISPQKGLPMIVADQDRQFSKSKNPVTGFVREMVDFA